MKIARCIYRFGGGIADGDGNMRELLGGKGAGLAEMSRLSLPVPPGFTVTTDVCREYFVKGKLSQSFQSELAEAMAWLEQETGRRFNDASHPLLVSVRSGAAVSMPGMMDTILNVGMNDQVADGFERETGSGAFARDCYRRLLQMFGSVVMGSPKAGFERELRKSMETEGAARDSDLSANALSALIETYKLVIQWSTGNAFPLLPQVQLVMAIEAVFCSWNSERAVFYRKLNQVPDAMGTAVTVQAMVFGNRGPRSGTGVGFTRNPSTGERCIFGEYMTNAQGEDIVAGVRTPSPIASMSANGSPLYAELESLVLRLEKHYREAQDFEFTVEDGRLFLLQTRAAKCSASAALRIAVDMAREGLISKSEAILRVKPGSITEILSPQLDLCEGLEPLAQGLPASPGAASGRITLSSDEAVAMTACGEDVILVTNETTAEDIRGMAASRGFLTARGGATSHAAVVARGMGKCCITGVSSICIDEATSSIQIGGVPFAAGDWISLDGNTGRVFAGRHPVKAVMEADPVLDELLAWCSEQNKGSVRANADTPDDAERARMAGATGIGLCRTEHMFFAPERLPDMRAMILAEDVVQRKRALERLLPVQQADFELLFRTMSPLPVTIRLLDPPLHEFLPSMDEIETQIDDARRDDRMDAILDLEKTRRRVEVLTETNPMMGHRGCRLSITCPEIVRMQVSAILNAALALALEGVETCPEIMVPLVSSEEEICELARLIDEAANEAFVVSGRSVPYKVGTMIELPRAAILAGSIAKHVSFVSFGTNDLTQMTYGFSRDDARSYLDSYLARGIFGADPFLTLDQSGVGRLIELAIRDIRLVDSQIKIGVCGEHGADPDSIRFFRKAGVDYVSCSPARIPVAQIAMAHAYLETPDRSQ